jgi:hypothetical protein
MEAELKTETEELDKLVTEHLKALEQLADAETKLNDQRQSLNRLSTALAAMKGEETKVEPAPAPVDTATPEPKAKPRERQSDNPYSDLSCNGCGKVGSLRESFQQTASGKAYRTLTCGGCGTVVM